LGLCRNQFISKKGLKGPARIIIRIDHVSKRVLSLATKREGRER